MGFAGFLVSSTATFFERFFLPTDFTFGAGSFDLEDPVVCLSALFRIVLGKGDSVLGFSASSVLGLWLFNLRLFHQVAGAPRGQGVAAGYIEGSGIAIVRSALDLTGLDTLDQALSRPFLGQATDP